MYGALLLFESEFVHIVAISFTSLILTELLMVALTIQTWHWLMTVAELLSLACYIASLVFLHEFIGKTPGLRPRTEVSSLISDRLLCRPGWPPAHREPLASVYLALGLKVCSATSGKCLLCHIWQTPATNSTEPAGLGRGGVGSLMNPSSQAQWAALSVSSVPSDLTNC